MPRANRHCKRASTWKMRSDRIIDRRQSGAKDGTGKNQTKVANCCLNIGSGNAATDGGIAPPLAPGVEPPAKTVTFSNIFHPVFRWSFVTALPWLFVPRKKNNQPLLVQWEIRLDINGSVPHATWLHGPYR